MKHKISRILCTALCCAPLTRLSTNKREEYFSQATLPGRTNVVPTKGLCRRHLPVASLCTPDECRRQASARHGRATGSGIHAGMRRIRTQRPQKHRPAPCLPGRISRYSPCQPHLRTDCLPPYFFEGNYDDALAMFNSARLDLLGSEERDDMTYRLATCYLKTGNVKEAAIWFETLRSTSRKYAADCAYYISYIRYTKDGMTKRSAVSCLCRTMPNTRTWFPITSPKSIC